MTRQAVSLAEINKWVVCLPSSTLKNKKNQTSLSTYNTFITPVTLLYWQKKKKKEAKIRNDNMFDKLWTSCLSITFLLAKNVGHVTDSLAALCSSKPFLNCNCLELVQS